MQKVNTTPVDAFNMAVGEFIANVEDTRTKHAANGDAAQYVVNHPVYHLMTNQQRRYYVRCVANPAVIAACKNVRLTVEDEGILADGPWGP